MDIGENYETKLRLGVGSSLHKNEINKLASQVKTKGYTIVPLEVYAKNGYIKILIGLAKGKHSYDKRDVLKQKAIKMDVNKQLKTAGF